MGKVAALAGFGTGASAIAVGGNYLAGNFDSKPVAKEEEQSQEDVSSPETSDDAQEEEEKGECWSDYFPDFDFNDWETDDSKKSTQELDKHKNRGNKLEPSFFTSNAKATPRSCLVVNWKKENYDDQKWTGEFHWLWAFVRGNNGFVWSLTMETKNDPSIPMELSGGIYFLKLQNSQWSLYKYKKWKSTTTLPEKITKTNLKNRFPIVGSAIPQDSDFGSDEKKKKHWGFISGEEDLEKICPGTGEKQCDKPQPPTPESFSGTWNWEPSTEEKVSDDLCKITDWSPNSKWWLDDIYTDTYTSNTISSALDQMKGKWTKEVASENSQDNQ